MFKELIKSFFFIFIAEMGDKTQIIAMTFATQYKALKVLVGVMIGVALNHGLAIVLGTYLSNVIPLNTVQIVAGSLFILFGLWTLKEDKDKDKETNRKVSLGPVMTVALAFFIGELGDKTQLTAMTLATGATYPLFILFGTILGMIATSGLGIYVGGKIGDKIPEFTLKIVSSSVFIFFGVLKLFQTVPEEYITSINVIVFFAVLGSIIYLLLISAIKRKQNGKSTALQEAAATLYIHTQQLKKAIDNICLGSETCGTCQGKQCLIGFVKKILNDAAEKGEYYIPDELSELPSYTHKDFDRSKIVYAFALTIRYLIDYGHYQDKNYAINKVREALEIIIFNENIQFKGDIDEYFNEMRKRDKALAQEIKEKVNEIR